MLEFFVITGIGAGIVASVVDIYQKTAPIVVETVTALF